MRASPSKRKSAGAPRQQSSARRILLGAGVLLLLTLAAYGPAMRNGFVWDDNDNVTENATLRSPEGLSRIWLNPSANQQYYPLTYTTFWVEYHLWKLKPFGYHLVNVLLHSLSAVLLWTVLRRLSVPGAWLAAAVFALHPVQVESVAWITERKNVLSGLFYLLALLAYVRFARIDVEGPRGSKGDRLCWGSYALALGLFICAVLSKSTTFSLPLALLLLLWWKRERLNRSDFFPLIPMFIIGVGMGATTSWLEKHHVGAIGEEWSLSIAERILVAGRALWFYAGKLLWPSKLTFIYPRWEINSGEVGQYLFAFAALAVPVALWLLRKRIGRAPLVAVLFFGITLAPALGFFNVFFMRYSYVQDHFQYLASIGVISLIAALLTECLRKLNERFGRPEGAVSPVLVVPAVILVILMTLTWRQGHAYRDAETLWRDTLTKNPSSWMAHNNLANILSRQGKLEKAVRHYTRALRVKPDHAKARYNLANVLIRQGKTNEAVSQYVKALRISPDSAPVHYNLGLALTAQGKVDEAIRHFSRAVQINPNHLKARLNLGLALAGKGKADDAITHFWEAVRVNPECVEAHLALGTIMAGQGKLDEAIARFRQALRIKPDYAVAHYNLAVALYRKGEYADAWKHVHLARNHGISPHPALLQALSEKMPEPKE